MNKLILPALLCVVSHGSFAQVENGDFEHWEKPLLFTHPYSTTQTFSSNYHTFVKNGQTNVNHVEADENSFMRIENIAIDNNVEPGYFLFGQDPTLVGQDLVFDGGLEITDTQVTGVSLDMNMNIPESNPGFVVVQFKHQGAPIGVGNHATGTYVFPISGNEGWTTRTFDFVMPIDPLTDECVIGVASADLINGDFPFVDGSFVEIDNVELINSADEVSGGTFDFWSYIIADEIPSKIQVDIMDLDDPSFHKTTNSQSGLYALSLTSMLDSDGEVVASTAFMGDVSDLGEITPTSELLSNHSMLSFYYQYLGLEGDKGSVKVVFYNDMNGIFQPVHFMEFDLENTATGDYVMFEYDFTEDKYESFPNATYMTIEFSSSTATNGNLPHVGSELTVDNVELSGTLGLLDALKAPQVKMQKVFVYPNPTTSRVSFRFNDVSSGYFKVYSAVGTLIATENYQSVTRIIHGMDDYAPGTYVFRFVDDSGVSYAHVVKQ